MYACMRAHAELVTGTVCVCVCGERLLAERLLRYNLYDGPFGGLVGFIRLSEYNKIW